MLALQEANKSLKKKNLDLMEQAADFVRVREGHKESMDKAKRRVNELERALYEKSNSYNETQVKLTAAELSLATYAAYGAEGPEALKTAKQKMDILERELKEHLINLDREKEEHIKTREDYKKMTNLLHDRADQLMKRNLELGMELCLAMQNAVASTELAKTMKENETLKSDLATAEGKIKKLEEEVNALKNSLKEALLKAAAEPVEDKFDKSNRECKERAEAADKQLKDLQEKTDEKLKALSDRQIEIEVEILNIRTENDFKVDLSVNAQKDYLAFSTLALDEKIFVFNYETDKTFEKMKEMKQSLGRYTDILIGTDSIWQHQQIQILNAEVKELFRRLENPTLSVENVAKSQGEALLKSMKSIEEEFRRKALLAEQVERDLRAASEYYSSQVNPKTFNVKTTKNKDRRAGNRALQGLNLPISIPKPRDQEAHHNSLVREATISIPKPRDQEAYHNSLVREAAKEIGAEWTKALANSVYESCLEEWSKLDYLSPKGNKAYDDRMTYDQWQWQKNRNIERFYLSKRG